MNDKDGMSKPSGPYSGARTAPPATHVRRWRNAVPMAAIRLCVALSLLAVGCPARAVDDAPSDVPVAEHIPDSPPTGIRLAPGVTFSGYGTLQFLAPDRRSRDHDASGHGDATLGDGDGTDDDSSQFS